jgi:hypothetical protein
MSSESIRDPRRKVDHEMNIGIIAESMDEGLDIEIREEPDAQGESHLREGRYSAISSFLA